MAKKPPQQPDPPFEDFDPDRELGEDIVPVDADDAIIHGIPEDDDAATQLDVAAIDEPAEVVDDDVLAEVVAEEGDEHTHLLVDDAEPVSAIVEDDDIAAEVVEDDAKTAGDLEAVDVVEDVVEDATEEIAVDDAILESDPLADESLIGAKSVEVDDIDSPHEAETLAATEALADDDPFSGVGGDGPPPGDEGELVGAGVGGGGDDEPYEEEEAPVPKLHWLQWTLIGLNIVAILAMPYLVLMTLQKRQQYTHAVFMHDLAMLGLPNEEEEKPNLTAARATLPRYYIPADQIKKIVSERIGGGASGDPYDPVDEQIVSRIAPSSLDKDLLRDHFGDVYVDSGEPINTVEKEIRRIAKEVAPKMEQAAQESWSGLNNDDAKRKAILNLLHPLAMDGFQSEEIDRLVKNAKGADLQKLYLDAAQRRMAFDFLVPLEFFRPGNAKELFVQRFGNVADRKAPAGVDGDKLKTLEALPIDDVMKRVTQRLESTIGDTYQPAIHIGDEYGSLKRDTIEKRLTAAFTLLSLAHVRRPDGELLFPKLLDRIPKVVGLYDFSLAAELFPRQLLTLNQQVLERIKIDRQGFEVPDKGNGVVRSKAFIDYYEDELQRIRFLQNDIFKANIRLKDLQDQKARLETLLAERTKQRQDVLERIAKARIKTKQEAERLHVFETEMHKNQVELSSSEEILERLDAEIRQMMKSKEAKTP
jgi:hypothetical protein